MRILVTGGAGQLGRAFSRISEETGYSITALGHEALDVTQYESILKGVDAYQPDAIVHAAAYTNVDGAERDFDGAFRLNVNGTRNVAAACLNRGLKMVYVSTDYVFDGTDSRPYREFDAVNPQTVYGRTKLYGEQLAAQICPRLFIARTAWLYGDGGNFVKTMLKLAGERQFLTVVNDQFGTPTYTVDLATAILAVLPTENYGTYHMTNQGQCSWYDFAREIFRIAGVDIEVRPVSTAEFPRPAKRPMYSVLENYMLEMTIGDPFRPWEEALAEYLANSMEMQQMGK